MSSGVVHKKASILLSAGFLAGSLYNPALVNCAFGALCGIIISPDLDVDRGNISNTIIRNKLGKIHSKLWDFIWFPYRNSFKHGKFASHFPVFSTIVRVFYIYFTVVFPVNLVLSLIPGYINFVYEMVWWLKYLFSPLPLYGLISSDVIHFVLDISTKENKDEKD